MRGIFLFPGSSARGIGISSLVREQRNRGSRVLNGSNEAIIYENQLIPSRMQVLNVIHHIYGKVFALCIIFLPTLAGVHVGKDYFQ